MPYAIRHYASGIQLVTRILPDACHVLCLKVRGQIIWMRKIVLNATLLCNMTKNLWLSLHTSPTFYQWLYDIIYDKLFFFSFQLTVVFGHERSWIPLILKAKNFVGVLNEVSIALLIRNQAQANFRCNKMLAKWRI